MQSFQPFAQPPPPSARPAARHNPLLTEEAIKTRVDAIAARLTLVPRDSDLPTCGGSADLARPHIESDTAYHWVVVERRVERERKTTQDLDELLYWVFEPVTFHMATSYASARHDPANGYRRALFRRQLELLTRLDPSWSARCRRELAAVLADHPFTDGGPQEIDWEESAAGLGYPERRRGERETCIDRLRHAWRSSCRWACPRSPTTRRSAAAR